MPKGYVDTPKKLQILVPHYHESEETVNFLLHSLSEQDSREFDVIICNDGADVVFSDEFLQRDYKITYVIKEHGGISHTRNTLLSLATSPYIMFCDCDDMFLHSSGIKWITSQENEYDVLSCAFLEWRDGKYYVHEHDGTFIHSKSYRRQFLIDEDIKFREDIPCHEDVYFVSLANCCAKQFYNSDDVKFYLYKENKSSTTHQDDFMKRTWNYYIQSKSYLIDDLMKKGKREAAEICTLTVLVDSWAEWNVLSHSKKRAVKRFYQKYKEYYETISKEDKEMIITHNMERFHVKEIDIDKFINELLS